MLSRLSKRSVFNFSLVCALCLSIVCGQSDASARPKQGRLSRVTDPGPMMLTSAPLLGFPQLICNADGEPVIDNPGVIAAQKMPVNRLFRKLRKICREKITQVQAFTYEAREAGIEAERVQSKIQAQLDLATLGSVLPGERVYRLIGLPKFGRVTLNGSTVRYEHNSTKPLSESDSFSVQVIGSSSSYLVTIVVNIPPKI